MIRFTLHASRGTHHMLFKISILTSLIFSVIYPLCFWISYKDPLKNNFHKFHIGLPNIVGGITLVFLLLLDIPSPIKILAVLWKLSFLSVSSYSWKKEYPKPLLMTVPCALGIITFAKVQEALIGPGLTLTIISILAGLIFCSSLFAMNLGHWYLNVHGLPMSHLARATYTFWLLVLLRFIWDAYVLLTGHILYSGDSLYIWQFMMKTDGFFLLIAIFFGTMFPLVSLYFATETLKLKNTQATTGILYVILCGVILGDLTYKYYLIKFGIAL